MKSIYISGPISADSREEEERHIHVAGRVATDYMCQGWAVFCPHTMTADIHYKHSKGLLQWRDYLAADIYWLSRCDAIHMLPGWKNSKGASIEYLVAKGLGLEILGEGE